MIENIVKVSAVSCRDLNNCREFIPGMQGLDVTALKRRHMTSSTIYFAQIAIIIFGQ
jgi:hypothetical protein